MIRESQVGGGGGLKNVFLVNQNINRLQTSATLRSPQEGMALEGSPWGIRSLGLPCLPSFRAALSFLASVKGTVSSELEHLVGAAEGAALSLPCFPTMP